MSRLKNIIENSVSGKKVLGFFILTNLVYAFMLIVTIPRTIEFSNGMKLLDMLPTGYDLTYVNKLFNTLGEDGRKIYLTNQIPVDMVYPFLFGLTYALVLMYFLKKLNLLNTPYLYLSLLPIIVGVADYLENFGIISMLIKYPEITETTIVIISTFSLIKSVSTSLFFIVLIIMLFLVGIKSLKKKRV